MLSRVAESVYWMSRYIERAESVARFIDVNLHLVLDLPRGTEEQWAPLVITTGDFEQFSQEHREATRENVIRFLTFEPGNRNSILSCLRAARENARSVREVISSEMWAQLNRFYLLVSAAAASERAMDAPHEFFSDVRAGSQHFLGVTNATLSHNEGWHFARMGGLLERADQTTRILDVKYFYLLPSPAHAGTPHDEIHWAALLRSASALEMYRKRHGRIAPERVAEFLLLDPCFPRAVRFCLEKADRSLHAITGTPPDTFGNTAEQELGRLRAELAFARAGDIMESGLHEFLDGVQARLNRTGDALFDAFFALRPTGAAALLQRA